MPELANREGDVITVPVELVGYYERQGWFPPPAAELALVEAVEAPADPPAVLPDPTPKRTQPADDPKEN